MLRSGDTGRLFTVAAQVLLGITCTHYYDDFCVCEPASTVSSGQESLRELVTVLGLAFSAAKAVDASEVVIFLGVETNLAPPTRGTVLMRVHPDRVQKLVGRIESIIQDGSLPSGDAASLVGKLQFTLSWAFGKVGRAGMQPLHALAASTFHLWRRLPTSRGNGGSAIFRRPHP